MEPQRRFSWRRIIPKPDMHPAGFASKTPMEKLLLITNRDDKLGYHQPVHLKKKRHLRKFTYLLSSFPQNKNIPWREGVNSYVFYTWIFRNYSCVFKLMCIWIFTQKELTRQNTVKWPNPKNTASRCFIIATSYRSVFENFQKKNHTL